MAGGTASPGIGFVLCGETITYSQPGTPGVDTTSSAITAVRVAVTSGYEAQTEKRTKFVIAAADIASPTEGDYFTDDAGQVWGVIHVNLQEGGTFELVCIHSEDT